MAERVLKVPPSLGSDGVEALHRGLDEAEADGACKVVVLEGADGVFCQGMDFEEMLERGDEQEGLHRFPDLLRRIATTRLVVIAGIDGKVMAGGLGLVAAADLAFATERSTFSLSEALWGLLPCVIAPYLVRRVGFQTAYEMTLTARTVPAEEARRLRLVDAVVPDLGSHLRVNVKRLSRLDSNTVTDIKRFFERMWFVGDDTRAYAQDELSRLLASHRVKKSISDYANFGRMPWESW